VLHRFWQSCFIALGLILDVAGVLGEHPIHITHVTGYWLMHERLGFMLVHFLSGTFLDIVGYRTFGISFVDFGILYVFSYWRKRWASQSPWISAVLFFVTCVLIIFWHGLILWMKALPFSCVQSLRQAFYLSCLMPMCWLIFRSD